MRGLVSANGIPNGGNQDYPNGVFIGDILVDFQIRYVGDRHTAWDKVRTFVVAYEP